MASIFCRYQDGTTKICNWTDSFKNIKVNGVFIGLTTEYNVNSTDEVEFILSGDVLGVTAFYGITLTNVTIGSGVTTIGENAFYDCDNLTSVIIPDSVTTIGGGAFDSCANLTSIVIPDSVNTIGGSAFRHCENLTSIVIPDSVTSIEVNTFYGCWELSNVQLPKNLTSIGSSAFYNCVKIVNITLPNTITEIKGSAFKECHNLTSIVIPDSVTSIGVAAFEECTRMTTLTIGSGCTNIGIKAFAGCDLLKTIYVKSLTAPELGWVTQNIMNGSVETYSPFNDYEWGDTEITIARNGTLYYPTGSDYTTWLDGTKKNLGYYGWNGVEMNPEDMPDDPDNPDIPTDPDNPDEPDTPDTPIDPDAPSIDLEYDKISAPQGGMNTTIDVETENVDDMQVIAPDWVDVIEKDGYYEIIIKPNEDGSDRTGEVIFIGNPSRPNRVQQNVIINQNSDNSEMAASISLEKNKITFDNTGYAESFGVKVTYTNAQEIYEPVCSEEWVTITELLPQQGGTTGGDTNATVKRYGFEVTETDIARIATVTFSCKGDTGRVLSNSSFVIEQMGKSEEETNVIVKAFMETGSVKYDGSSTGISIDSLGCGYSNFANILAPIVDVDWIHLGEGVLQSGYGYDEIYRYPISFDVNEGAERVGVITFVATDEMGDEYTDTCTITQLAKPYEPEKPEIPEGGDNETYSPIWKDVEYVFGGDDVVYEIYAEQYVKYINQWVKEDVLIFRSRVYAAPNETVVRVSVNKICQNYMTENPNIFTGSVGYGHSFATFKLKDQYGTLLHTYHFINDWSYDELTLGLKTNPITPYIGDGQKLFFSTFATDEKRINWGMRYYDGTPDYNMQQKISNDFETLVVTPSREKGVKTFYFGANSFNVLPKCQCKYVLYYVNPKGGYDWFTITGRVSRRDRLETYTVTQNYNNTTADFGKKRYLSTININYQVNTQWLTQEQSNRMWELLESNTVWLHNLEEDKIYPVIITDTEVEHKYKTNSNKMLSYQINLELSHTRERI